MLALTLYLPAAEVEPAEKVKSEGNATRVLLTSIYRIGIGSQVVERAGELVRGAELETVVEVETAADVFRAEIGNRIRMDLERTFGQTAREIFGTFVEQFSEAEYANDEKFLARTVGLSELWSESPPQTYTALRTAMIGGVLKVDIAAAGAFLADVQTWLDLRKRNDDVPALRAWLDRGKPVQVVAEVEQISETVAPKRQRNPLRAAEAKAQELEDPVDDSGGALEQFGAARTERRRKALEDARAGMQQVAEERRGAEEEVASKKMTAAQAEADAVRKHAEKLASAEGEAIEQRRNSWGNRLKSVLTTTIGATSGAFLGTVGSRAGEAAAEAVFNTEGQNRHHGHHGHY